MTKTELVKLLREATGMTSKVLEEYLARLGDIMAAELLAGGEVPLPRIGKIIITHSAERQGRNPKTGEKITIAAKRKARFKMSKDLKEALN